MDAPARSAASPAFARTQHKRILVTFEGDEFTVAIDNVLPGETAVVARRMLGMVVARIQSGTPICDRLTSALAAFDAALQGRALASAAPEPLPEAAP